MQITVYIATGISVVSWEGASSSVCREISMTMLMHMLGKQQMNVTLPKN